MLGYTSNLVSSGLREIIRFLVQHKYISGIVTTAGGIEEDLIKCLGPTYLTHTGDFNVDGAGLRKRGLNRIGNLIVPNDNYCKFEDWVMPILDEMVEEQVKDKIVWSPSTVIARLGKEINNEESILYWAAKVGLLHLMNYLQTEAEQIPLFHRTTYQSSARLSPMGRWVICCSSILIKLQHLW
jgi:deoxyhypusine synthase